MTKHRRVRVILYAAGWCLFGLLGAAASYATVGDDQPPDPEDAPSPPPPAPQQPFVLLPAQGDGKTIGSACKPQDAWLPDAPETLPEEVREGDGPGFHYVPEGYKTGPDIGELHCLTGSVFPYGYLSAHCTADADCPSGALCDCEPGAACSKSAPGQCRAPCSDDSECLAPTTCKPVGAVRYCKCAGECPTTTRKP